jgi:hypothetical protein
VDDGPGLDLVDNDNTVTATIQYDSDHLDDDWLDTDADGSLPSVNDIAGEELINTNHQDVNEAELLAGASLIVNSTC